MTCIIEPHISAYIDTAIERQRRIFDANLKQEADLIRTEVGHQIGLAAEVFEDQSRQFGETIDSKIRVGVREETGPRFDRIENQISEIHQELSKHEVRLTRLERARA